MKKKSNFNNFLSLNSLLVVLNNIKPIFDANNIIFYKET